MEIWFWVIVISASSAWVYWDASKHKIGQIKDQGGMFNMSAGAWAAVTLGLWIVGLPAYLINRSRLIERAQENPRESIFMKGGIVILAVFMFGAAYILVPGFLASVPKCNNSVIVSLTEQIVADNPIVRQRAAQQPGTRATIIEHAELSYDAEADIRRCSAVVRMPPLEERVIFEISWSDKSAGEVWVEFTN